MRISCFNSNSSFHLPTWVSKTLPQKSLLVKTNRILKRMWTATTKNLVSHNTAIVKPILLTPFYFEPGASRLSCTHTNQFLGICRSAPFGLFQLLWNQIEKNTSIIYSLILKLWTKGHLMIILRDMRRQRCVLYQKKSLIGSCCWR